MTGPDPKSIYPMKDYNKLVFLKHFVKASNIFIGDYTYFDDRRYGPDKFEEYNVLYNYDFSKVKLTIGKFCAIAAETRFIMTGDHKLDAISTYPFPIFGNGWETAFNVFDLPVKGNITIGNDVWFGLRLSNHEWSNNWKWSHHCCKSCRCQRCTSIFYRRWQSCESREDALR